MIQKELKNLIQDETMCLEKLLYLTEGKDNDLIDNYFENVSDNNLLLMFNNSVNNSISFGETKKTIMEDLETLILLIPIKRLIRFFNETNNLFNEEKINKKNNYKLFARNQGKIIEINKFIKENILNYFDNVIKEF